MRIANFAYLARRGAAPIAEFFPATMSSMSTQDPEPFLDSTLKTLEGGVTTIPLSDGRQNLQAWMDILAAEPTSPELDAVLLSLRDLKELLNGTTPIEVATLQTLCKQLGQQVQAIADGMPTGDDTQEKPRKRRKLSEMAWILANAI